MGVSLTKRLEIRQIIVLGHARHCITSQHIQQHFAYGEFLAMSNSVPIPGYLYPPSGVQRPFRHLTQ